MRPRRRRRACAFTGAGAHVDLAGRTRARLEALADDIGDAAGVAEVDALAEHAVAEHADAVAADAGGKDITLNTVSLESLPSSVALRRHGGDGHATARSRGRTGRPHRGPASSMRAPLRAPVVDAVIVGGGPAGLSAALVLGRARRNVLVLDSGRPANAASGNAIGGLLGQPGVPPAELRRAGREQLAELPSVEVRDGEVLDVDPLAEGLAVRLERGWVVRTRALVLAHGLRYDPPPLPGVGALWGRSVFHCPFCDGWEVRDRPLAVHGNGPAAARSALVLSGWSSDVVLCTDGPARLNGERAALEQAGVRVREEQIRGLAGHDGRLERIEFEAGRPERRDALFVRTQRDQPNSLAAELGCQLTDEGTIVIDSDGRTGIPGVYAAGDAATEHSRSVANAIGSGSRAAYAVALDLVSHAASPRLAVAA